jgi:hypothetical protein
LPSFRSLLSCADVPRLFADGELHRPVHPVCSIRFVYPHPFAYNETIGLTRPPDVLLVSFAPLRSTCCRCLPDWQGRGHRTLWWSAGSAFFIVSVFVHCFPALSPVVLCCRCEVSGLSAVPFLSWRGQTVPRGCASQGCAREDSNAVYTTHAPLGMRDEMFSVEMIEEWGKVTVREPHDY